MERVKRKRLLWWFEEWELEEMQNWLSEMAQQGWHLESGDGRASFRQGSRQRVRYRCEYGDVEGLPAEQLEIYAAAGWEYVRQHGHVHIFRAPDDQSIPEIHTEVASRLRMLRPLARNLILSALLFVAWVTLSLWLRLPDSEPLELQMLLSTGPATLVARRDHLCRRADAAGDYAITEADPSAARGSSRAAPALLSAGAAERSGPAGYVCFDPGAAGRTADC
ncbi:MAG: DUF2812 domain-containing protein [Bacillota bacterium]